MVILVPLEDPEEFDDPQAPSIPMDNNDATATAPSFLHNDFSVFALIALPILSVPFVAMDHFTMKQITTKRRLFF
jgi:hypothetical protein